MQIKFGGAQILRHSRPSQFKASDHTNVAMHQLNFTLDHWTPETGVTRPSELYPLENGDNLFLYDDDATTFRQSLIEKLTETKQDVHNVLQELLQPYVHKAQGHIVDLSAPDSLERIGQ